MHIAPTEICKCAREPATQPSLAFRFPHNETERVTRPNCPIRSAETEERTFPARSRRRYHQRGLLSWYTEPFTGSFRCWATVTGRIDSMDFLLILPRPRRNHSMSFYNSSSDLKESDRKILPSSFSLSLPFFSFSFFLLSPWVETRNRNLRGQKPTSQEHRVRADVARKRG